MGVFDFAKNVALGALHSGSGTNTDQNNDAELANYAEQFEKARGMADVHAAKSDTFRLTASSTSQLDRMSSSYERASTEHIPLIPIKGQFKRIESNDAASVKRINENFSLTQEQFKRADKNFSVIRDSIKKLSKATGITISQVTGEIKNINKNVLTVDSRLRAVANKFGDIETRLSKMESDKEGKDQYRSSSLKKPVATAGLNSGLNTPDPNNPNPNPTPIPSAMDVAGTVGVGTAAYVGTKAALKKAGSAVRGGIGRGASKAGGAAGKALGFLGRNAGFLGRAAGVAGLAYLGYEFNNKANEIGGHFDQTPEEKFKRWQEEGFDNWEWAHYGGAADDPEILKKAMAEEETRFKEKQADIKKKAPGSPYRGRGGKTGKESPTKPYSRGTAPLTMAAPAAGQHQNVITPEGTFQKSYERAKVEDQKSQFMKFGELPPGFEFMPGNKGRLGMPQAVAATGAMPLTGGTGTGGSYGGSSGRGGAIDDYVGPLGNTGRTMGTRNERSDTGTGVPGTLASNDKGFVDATATRSAIIERIKNSKLNGFVPPDGKMYGITTGAPEEWATYLTSLAKHESGLNNGTVGDKAAFKHGSRGLFQLSPEDAQTYGFQKTPFSYEQLADPNFNIDTAVKIHEHWVVDKEQSIKGGAGKYWGPLSKEGWTPGRGRDSDLPYADWAKQDAEKSGVVPEQRSGVDKVAFDKGLYSDQSKRPYHFKGQLDLEGVKYDYGTGGRQRGSIPYGDHEIKPGLHQKSKYREFEGNSFYVKDMFDPKLGDTRQGILIHNQTDLDRLYSAGCIAIDKNQWQKFKAHLLDYQKRTGGPIQLSVNPDGSASIGPKGMSPTQSVGTVVSDRPTVSGNEPGAIAAQSLLERVKTLRVKGADMSDLKSLEDLSKKGQAFGGGKTSEASLALATMIQDKFGDDLTRFTGFNDDFHEGRRSHHATGNALDATFKSGAKGTKLAMEQVKKWAKEAGIDPNDLELKDEYTDPSAHASGGHGHFAFRNKAAAEKFMKWYNETQGVQPESGQKQQIPGAPQPGIRLPADIEAEARAEGGLGVRGGGAGIAPGMMESSDADVQRNKENEDEKQTERVHAVQQEAKARMALGVPEGVKIEKGKANAAGPAGGIVSEDRVKAQTVGPSGGIVTREERAPPPPPKDRPAVQERTSAEGGIADSKGEKEPAKAGGDSAPSKPGNDSGGSGPSNSTGRYNPETQGAEPGSGAYGCGARCFVMYNYQ